MDRIVAKHKNVDDEVYTNLNYKADKQELKERTKDLSSLSKKRVKEEAKIIQDSNAALAEGITSLPSALANRGSAAPAGKGKKYDSDDGVRVLRVGGGKAQEEGQEGRQEGQEGVLFGF